MPARWMEAKLARMKPRNLRFVKTGSMVEARYTEQRQVDLPQDKHRDDAIIASFKGKVRRVPCTGRMPARSYGKTCKGHTREGLNLNSVSERTARERPYDFAPKSLLNWASEDRPCTLIKVTR